MEDNMDKTFKKLSSANPKVILEGIKEIDSQIQTGVDPEDIPIVFDALTSLFYVDTFDRPELIAEVGFAQKTTARLGNVVIPLIIEKIHDTDIKAELLFAQTCGLMGEDAIEPLLKVFDQKHDSIDTAFALYAFGKIKSPEIQKALPTILKAIESPKKETEDTAVRALGKICESMDQNSLDENMKEKIASTLMSKCSHSNDVIRAKAIRGLGKFVRYGFSIDIQENEIRTYAENILGINEEDERDPAYLVRREAQEILDTIL